MASRKKKLDDVKSVEIPGLTAEELLEPTKGNWRIIVDFPPDMTAEIKDAAKELGNISWQATIKVLLAEALLSRKERLAAVENLKRAKKHA